MQYNYNVLSGICDNQWINLLVDCSAIYDNEATITIVIVVYVAVFNDTYNII